MCVCVCVCVCVVPQPCRWFPRLTSCSPGWSDSCTSYASGAESGACSLHALRSVDTEDPEENHQNKGPMKGLALSPKPTQSPNYRTITSHDPSARSSRSLAKLVVMGSGQDGPD